MGKSASSYKSLIDCICPRCGKTYKRHIFWTGRGIPKIFCNACKSTVEDRSDDEPYVVSKKTVNESLTYTFTEQQEEQKC